MLQHHETRILPYTAEQLFDLVIDIEKYPEFLPWVVGLRVKDRQTGIITADLAAGYKIYTEKFTCKVHYERPHKIHVDYVQGPLKHLTNDWTFENVAEGCQITFHVDFEFKSSLFQTIAAQFFDVALSRMTEAFEKRAAEVYGAGGDVNNV